MQKPEKLTVTSFFNEILYVLHLLLKALHIYVYKLKLCLTVNYNHNVVEGKKIVIRERSGAQCNLNEKFRF